MDQAPARILTAQCVRFDSSKADLTGEISAMSVPISIDLDNVMAIRGFSHEGVTRDDWTLVEMRHDRYVVEASFVAVNTAWQTYRRYADSSPWHRN